MTAARPGRLVIVINDLEFLLSHRLAIAQVARDGGHEVHVAAPANAMAERRLAAAGLHFHHLAMGAHRTNPATELRTLRSIHRLFRRLKPDIVHLVTIKPVLYGGIAARLAGVSSVVSAISGLGYVFAGHNPRGQLIGRLIRPLYRYALGHPRQRIIFQNPDDRALIAGLGVKLGDRAEVIKGSGVDLQTFTPAPEPDGQVTVVLPARLLHDKGIGEFVEAARILRRNGVPARFALVGDAPANNPAAIPADKLSVWKAEGAVEFWGFRNDMPAVFAQSHIVALPSYREGLPKALIEAAACGRPVVTTDTPGCRDAITDGETGLLVPVRDTPALVSALSRLIANRDLRARMGAAARRLAEREFSVGHVVARHMEIYRGLLAHDNPIGPGS